MAVMGAVTGFHHVAFRCRDTGTTRAFYEGVLGLPLVKATAIDGTRALHTFFRLGDGSFLAFFEAPEQAFEFRAQHDFDLHVALEVAPDALGPLVERARAAGVEVRGPVDHGIIHSAYLRDPDGYVVELAERSPGHDAALDPAHNGARETLAAWQRRKPIGGPAGCSSGPSRHCDSPVGRQAPLRRQGDLERKRGRDPQLASSTPKG